VKKRYLRGSLKTIHRGPDNTQRYNQRRAITRENVRVNRWGGKKKRFVLRTRKTNLMKRRGEGGDDEGKRKAKDQIKGGGLRGERRDCSSLKRALKAVSFNSRLEKESQQNLCVGKRAWRRTRSKMRISGKTAKLTMGGDVVGQTRGDRSENWRGHWDCSLRPLLCPSKSGDCGLTAFPP